jgi:zinc and cadmium transporter
VSTGANILAATLLVSLASLSGVLFLSMQPERVTRISAWLVAFASGTLIGGAFFHLIPESLRLGNATFPLLVAGILSFFALEKFLCWQHCHEARCEVHNFTYLNLVGDCIHNFIDGLIIAGGFLVSAEVGIVTTAVVLFHEVPQEIGEFGVLTYGGFSAGRAVMINGLTGLTAVMGGTLGYLFSVHVKGLAPLLLPFAAGAFAYIALADLIPELHRQRKPGESLAQFSLMVLGAILLWGARCFSHPG